MNTKPETIIAPVHQVHWGWSQGMAKGERRWTCSCGARGVTTTEEQAKLRTEVGCPFED